MISSEHVDLTRNRDFRPRRIEIMTRLDAILELTRAQNSALIEIMNRPVGLGPEQFDKLVIKNKFFPSPHHYSQASEIFNRDREKEFTDELRAHCLRCGKYVALPWRLTRGLCSQCSHVVDEKRIPWKRDPQEQERRVNIFDLR